MIEEKLKELENIHPNLFTTHKRLKQELLSICKSEIAGAKQQSWEAGYNEAVDTHDKINRTELRERIKRITKIQLAEACRQQREICANQLKLYVDDDRIDGLHKLILNAPVPKGIL